MFCKYCGNPVDPGKPACPQCGCAIHTSGGNGFWDLAGRPEPEYVPVVQPAAPAEERSAPRPPVLYPVLAALVLIAALIVTVVSANANRRAIAALQHDFQDQLRQQSEQVQAIEDILQQQSEQKLTIEDIQKRLEELDALAHAPAPEPQSNPIRINHAPADESRPIGFENTNNGCLFSFRIEGSAVAFQWDKLTKDGKWESLQFDENNEDARYGLRLEEDLERGETKLIAVGLTEESSGQYRCTVKTDHDEMQVFVRLTLSDELSPDDHAQPPTEPRITIPPTEPPTQAPTEAPTEVPTEPPTESPTEPRAIPQPA